MRFFLMAIPAVGWNIIDADCIYGNFSAEEFLKPMKLFLVLSEGTAFFFGRAVYFDVRFPVLGDE